MMVDADLDDLRRNGDRGHDREHGRRRSDQSR
jgi:hypothetical protein